MEFKPSENTKLYGMSHFFDEIAKLYSRKKMPTKILLLMKIINHINYCRTTHTLIFI